MTTKTQYVAQAKAANPQPMFANINGAQVELSESEYDDAITAWAEMRVAQDTYINEQTIAKESARAKLAALGLTDTEINALVGA